LVRVLELTAKAAVAIFLLYAVAGGIKSCQRDQEARIKQEVKEQLRFCIQMHGLGNCL